MRGSARLVTSALLAAALLWLPSLGVADDAGARVFTLAGRVQNDADARVTMRLVKRRGTPRAVRHVVFRNVDHQCSDGREREFNLVLRHSRISRIGITNRFTFFELLMRPSGLGAPNDRNQLSVTGQMNRGARRIAGNVDSTIRLAPVPPAIANACVTGTNRSYIALRPRPGRR